jgi:hypothetical protein
MCKLLFVAVFIAVQRTAAQPFPAVCRMAAEHGLHGSGGIGSGSSAAAGDCADLTEILRIPDVPVYERA